MQTNHNLKFYLINSQKEEKKSIQILQVFNSSREIYFFLEA